MDDLQNNAEQPNRDLINVDQEHDRHAWAERLCVTDDQLQEAVRAAGNSPNRVRDYLNVKRFIERLKDYAKRRKAQPHA